MTERTASGTPGRSDIARMLRGLPDVRSIAERALKEVLRLRGGGQEAIRRDFSAILMEAEDAAHRMYREAEERAVSSSLAEVLDRLTRGLDDRRAIIDAVAGNAVLLNRFFMALAQGRRSRAGRTLEMLLEWMFTRLEVPFARSPRINGKPDFIFPSAEYFEQNPLDCLIFTVKRTLRERWRQIATEGAQGAQFFLATLEPPQGDRVLSEMMRAKITLVVPRQRLSASLRGRNVISFEQFIEDHLEAARQRWRRAGISR
jgi:hypothetical protein